MPSGVDERAYPLDKSIVNFSQIGHELAVKGLATLWFRKNLIGLVQFFHLCTRNDGIARILVRMIALSQGPVGGLDYHRFGRMHQTKNGVIVFSQLDLPD